VFSSSQVLGSIIPIPSTAPPIRRRDEDEADEDEDEDDLPPCCCEPLRDDDDDDDDEDEEVATNRFDVHGITDDDDDGVATTRLDEATLVRKCPHPPALETTAGVVFLKDALPSRLNNIIARSRII